MASKKEEVVVVRLWNNPDGPRMSMQFERVQAVVEAMNKIRRTVRVVEQGGTLLFKATRS